MNDREVLKVLKLVRKRLDFYKRNSLRCGLCVLVRDELDNDEHEFREFMYQKIKTRAMGLGIDFYDNSFVWHPSDVDSRIVFVDNWIKELNNDGKD